MKELKAFTVKAHWGLLIRQGMKTCENRSFRVPPCFYLVDASSSLSFSEWCAGSMWIAERFGTAIICPSFDECRSWGGTDRVRGHGRVGADGVVGPVVSGRRGLKAGKTGAVRKGRRGKGQPWGVGGERGSEGKVRQVSALLGEKGRDDSCRYLNDTLTSSKST